MLKALARSIEKETMITCNCYKYSSWPAGRDLVVLSFPIRLQIIKENGHQHGCSEKDKLSVAGDPFHRPEAPNYAGDPFYAATFSMRELVQDALKLCPSRTISRYDCHCYKWTWFGRSREESFRLTLLKYNGHVWNCKFFPGVR